MAKMFIRPMAVADYVEAMSDVATSVCPWMNLQDAGMAYFKAGPCFAGFLDDQLVGVAGVCCQIPGLGEAWAHLTRVGRAHGLAVTREVARFLVHIIREKKLIRVQADTLRDHVAGRVWLLRLGFRRESRMPLYVEGKTMDRYVMYPLGNPPRG